MALPMPELPIHLRISANLYRKKSRNKKNNFSMNITD